MAKRFAQSQTSALDSCMPLIQVCKSETMHRGHRVSGSLRHVYQHLIRKANKTPSTSLGKQEKERNQLHLPFLHLLPKTSVA